MTIGERIKKRRIEMQMSVDDLAEIIGKNRATIYRYESDDIEKLPITILEPLAKALLTTPAELMGWKKESDVVPQGVKIPVLGYVRAGIPIEAVEEILDYEEISRDMARQGEYFALSIKGDSMEPKISEGDVVIVRRQETVENGEYAVVLINGNDATVKKFYKLENGIKLLSTNPSYDPFFYTADEVNSLPVRVVGKVVELRAKF